MLLHILPQKTRGLAKTDKRPCDTQQTMLHIINSMSIDQAGGRSAAASIN